MICLSVQVTFDLCPTVHMMHLWQFAYAEARKGSWELLCLDRNRFENRIKGLNHIISPVLEVNHREMIFNERFMEREHR